jgi:hypothetical protein
LPLVRRRCGTSVARGPGCCASPLSFCTIVPARAKIDFERAVVLRAAGPAELLLGTGRAAYVRLASAGVQARRQRGHDALRPERDMCTTAETATRDRRGEIAGGGVRVAREPGCYRRRGRQRRSARHVNNNQRSGLEPNPDPAADWSTPARGRRRRTPGTRRARDRGARRSSGRSVGSPPRRRAPRRSSGNSTPRTPPDPSSSPRDWKGRTRRARRARRKG